MLGTRIALKTIGSITNPPAFENRNSTCATQLIWEYLLDIGTAVASLEPLIQITYQGDTHRSSEALKQSRIDGPHAKLKQLKTEHKDTTEVYRQMVLWLRSYTKKPMKQFICLLIVLFAILPMHVHFAGADEWHQWRGEDREGIWNETDIIEEFEGAEIPLRWRVPIGSGYSGPSVADGRVYVTDRLTKPEQVERVHCFDWGDR